MHRVIYDEDGPDKNEVIWMLESIRRAVHTVYLFYEKREYERAEDEVNRIFDHALSAIGPVSNSSEISGAGAELAINELRRMASRAFA